MRERKTHVYRLNVTYPPTSHQKAEGEWNRYWQPEGWNGASEGEGGRFDWPVVKLCLSKSTADRRASLLESYGAKVTIEKSAPVKWREN